MAAPVKRARSQRGVVLFVALVALLILSLLGVLAATTARLESKMAQAGRERDLAEIAAFSALAEGSAQVRKAAAAGADRVCAVLACVASPGSLSGTSKQPGEHALSVDLTALSGADESARAAAPARWSVVDGGQTAAGAAPPRHAYRLQAIGFGSDAQYVASAEATIELAP